MRPDRTREQALEALERAEGVPGVLRTMCRELAVHLDASACLLSRVIGDLLIEIAEHSNAGDPLTGGHPYLISDFPLTQAVLDRNEGRIVSLADPVPDPSEAALLRELGFESVLMLPLVSNGATWGLVELYADSGEHFRPEHVGAAAPILRRVGELLVERERAAAERRLPTPR